MTFLYKFKRELFLFFGWVWIVSFLLMIINFFIFAYQIIMYKNDPDNFYFFLYFIPLLIFPTCHFIMTNIKLHLYNELP